jgi:hypothetical protein
MSAPFSYIVLKQCSYPPRYCPGALKATGNRGLQPAMDHILENESKPVPSLDSVAESAGGSSAPMDVDDDDEETALLKAQMGAVEGVEAKVCLGLATIEKGRNSIISRVSSVPNVVKSSRTRL